jgi:WhiB family redox-sensing transcriptional regulator
MTPLQQYQHSLEEQGLAKSTVEEYVRVVSRFLRENTIEEVTEKNFSKLFHNWIEGRRGTITDRVLNTQGNAVRMYAEEVFDIDLGTRRKSRAKNPPPQYIVIPKDPMLPYLDHADDGRWREQAACATVGLAVMFDSSAAGKARAKAVCAGCPVTEQCLDFALQNDLAHGVWGGPDKNERTALL